MLVFLTHGLLCLVLVVNTMLFTKAVSMVSRCALLKLAEKKFSRRLMLMLRILTLCTCLAVLRSMIFPSSILGPLCMEILVVCLQIPLMLSTWCTLLSLRLHRCPWMRSKSTITIIVFGLLVSFLEVVFLPFLLVLLTILLALT